MTTDDPCVHIACDNCSEVVKGRPTRTGEMTPDGVPVYDWPPLARRVQLDPWLAAHAGPFHIVLVHD